MKKRTKILLASAGVVSFLGIAVTVWIGLLVLGSFYHEWKYPVSHIRNERYVVSKYYVIAPGDHSAWTEIKVVDLNSWKRAEVLLVVLQTHYRGRVSNMFFVEDSVLCLNVEIDDDNDDKVLVDLKHLENLPIRYELPAKGYY